MKPQTHAQDPSVGDESATIVTETPASETRAPASEHPVRIQPDAFDNLGEIGRGGMGRVYRVFDKTLLRPCAMKVLAPEVAKDASYQTRFVQEAQITGQLDHPNIVPVHRLGTDEQGTLYFTMKLVDGETLFEKLHPFASRARRPGWIAEYLEIFVKVCDALAFAHSRGVIHRDLKPANVIVGSFGQVYLMDWGIARILNDDGGVVVSPIRSGDEFDAAGVLVGTIEFMAPEQAWGEIDNVDARTDIFSLGALLYYILSGQTPYQARSEKAKLAAVRIAAVTPIESHTTTGDLPAGLCRIAMRAMAREPADRYPSVEALKSDVLHYLRGAPELVQRRFAKGEIIVREGEIGEAAYFIREGKCQAYKTVGGEKVVLREMGANEVFGELGILSSKPRTATVEALEDLMVDIVEASTLRDGVGLHTWLAPFIDALAERFREVDGRLTTATVRPPPPPPESDES